MRRFRDAASSFVGKAMSLIIVGVIGGTFACLSFSAQTRPLVPAERRYDPYSGQLPVCGDDLVLGQIQSRFHDRERSFWTSGLEIVGFGEVREIGMRSNGLDYIPRRYCMAQVLLNDRSAHTVSYAIAEDLGFIGWGFGVDWCVAGLDRNYAYAPDCQMARP
jgi:hypothetical protein